MVGTVSGYQESGSEVDNQGLCNASITEESLNSKPGQSFLVENCGNL